MDYLLVSEWDRSQCIKRIEHYALPCTVSIFKGKRRSIEQNKLQRKWLLELQEQGDQTAEEYRGYCKLVFGVPILRNENDGFREVYDRLIRARPYQEKLELMMVPMDLPVTRIMTTKQKTQYLDQMYAHFTEQGFVLTVPDG